MHSNSVCYDIPKINDNQQIFNKAQTIPDNQYQTINECKNISNSNISQETTEAKKNQLINMIIQIHIVFHLQIILYHCQTTMI